MNRRESRKWPSPRKIWFQRKQPVRPKPLHFKGVASKTSEGPKHHRHQNRNNRSTTKANVLGKGPAVGGGEDRQIDNGREGAGQTTHEQEGGGTDLGGTDNRAGGGRTISTTGKQEGQTGLQKEGGAAGSPTTRGREERGDRQHNRRRVSGRPSRRDGGQATKQDEGAQDQTWKGLGRVFVLSLRLGEECKLGNSHLMASSAKEVQLASWCNG